MASAAATITEVHPESGRTYRIKDDVEIFPLDSSSTQPRYVVRSGHDKSFVVSEELKNILELFDGSRTVDEVARTISAGQAIPVSGEQMFEKLSKLIGPHHLIEEVGKAHQTNSRENGKKPPPRTKTHSFELVFRLPLISPRIAERITRRLIWFFEPAFVLTAVGAMLIVQLVFLSNWFAARPAVTFGPKDILIDYALILATALFHEFGHATACRRYRCEHGPIGFLLYMIFPSLYVNLSNAWRLPGKKRAVIDIGGIYFQLLTTIPLYLIYLMTGDTHCAVVILSVDSMVLFSLNPILKFDGYWLLVDLSGLVNLRTRGWRVAKEAVFWSLGLRRDMPILNEVSGKGKKLLLIFYSFMTLALFTSFVFFLIAFAPARVSTLANTVHEIAKGSNKGAQAILQNVGRLLTSLFFFMFAYRLLQNTVFKLIRNRRKSNDSAK